MKKLLQLIFLDGVTYLSFEKKIVAGHNNGISLL